MIKIGLQGGHLGRTSGSTGTVGEQELTRRIRTRLSELLITRGFQLFLFDADPPKDVTLAQDFGLFLALHGDMDYAGDNGGGFADYPEPSTDGATTESQRVCKIINDSYFTETKIKYVNRSNANTRYYYMWKQISAKTPCVIIEMGQVKDPHDSVLLGNTELIAGALARAVCKAFNINYEVVVPTPPPVDPKDAQIDELNNQIKQLKKALFDKDTELTTKLAVMQTNCQNYRLSDKLKFKADLKKWAEEY